jgi:hypothetical protein
MGTFRGLMLYAMTGTPADTRPRNLARPLTPHGASVGTSPLTAPGHPQEPSYPVHAGIS